MVVVADLVTQTRAVYVAWPASSRVQHRRMGHLAELVVGMKGRVTLGTCPSQLSRRAYLRQTLVGLLKKTTQKSFPVLAAREPALAVPTGFKILAAMQSDVAE